MENLNRYERAKLLTKLKKCRTIIAICMAIAWILCFLFFVILDVTDKTYIMILPCSAFACTFVYCYILSIIFKIENLK